MLYAYFLEWKIANIEITVIFYTVMTTLSAIKSMNYSIRTTLAFLFYWAVVVAQLAERLLTISEVHRFETNYCQNFIMKTFTVSFFKDENKEKRDRECPIFLNKTIHVLLYCRHNKFSKDTLKYGLPVLISQKPFACKLALC